MMELVATEAERLDKFLARLMPQHSRSKLAKIADEGKILVNGTARKPSFALRSGDKVVLEDVAEGEAHDLTPADIALDVRYEDEYLLVVNKQRGLAVHPAVSLKEPSLVNALLARSHGLSSAGGSFRPGIVHRLDKDTTGLLLVAKTDNAHVRLAKQIEKRHASRRYVAVAAGNIEHERFDVAASLGRSKKNRLLIAVDPEGKNALTHFKKLARLDSGTLLACSLETGRTHQIRVHLQSMGHPVLGDRLYAPAAYRSVPLQLHAAFMAFEHPISGETIRVFAEPPEDFLGVGLVREEMLDPF
ncbi:MAG TPA: RluA family pseudouridine synthase [Fimbriimonadaceae bacterium]|jgi:23S rRNA pseudouridine1911/1915/1917 synthase